MFIGIACLPQRCQPLPNERQCTIIGWGKRNNRDEFGTNILHEAEVNVGALEYLIWFPCVLKLLSFSGPQVPIISNEECRNVYHEYTITSNMFCAGHKRGRIDTCAGDSGGPLLCRYYIAWRTS